jgi:hypothetical protein
LIGSGERAINVIARRTTMSTTANQPRTREEMIAFLVRSNDSRLRSVLTLTPDVIDWLNAMIENETARYAKLSDTELTAACAAA